MATRLFGDLFKELRRKQGLTLREFCKQHNFDPGNISRMERGKVAPPTREEALERLAQAVGLAGDSPRKREFISYAMVSAGRIPQEILSDEEALLHLPPFLCVLRGERLKKDQLQTLVDVIKSA